MEITELSLSRKRTGSIRIYSKTSALWAMTVGTRSAFQYQATLHGARNLIGYIDPNLSQSDKELAKQKVIESILADVNYFEISIQSDGSRGQSLVYYIDNLKVHTKDTTQHPLSITSFSLINEKTGAVIQEFTDSLTLDLAKLSLKHLAIQVTPFLKKLAVWNSALITKPGIQKMYFHTSLNSLTT